MPVSRNPARPVSGSPAYSPDDLPVYRGGGAAPAPIACTVTLTHDGLDALGLAPMSVTGQTVSVTGDGVSDYGMWTGASGVPVDWVGVRVVELANLARTGSLTVGFHQIARASDLDNVNAFWQESLSEWTVVHGDAAGAVIGSINVTGTISDHFAIGIDGATGDAIVYQNGSPVVTSATTADSGTFAGLAGMFSGDSAIIVNQARQLALGDTYSAEIITQFDKYTQTYPAGTLDWCGNPIGAAFNPVALPDLLAYYDIRRTDTLFQDTAGTTPVAVATDPIGRWDAVGPSGAPDWTQGTATSRPLYQLTPTRADFDLLDDSLSVTLPAISGGQIVIVSPAGIWIDSLTFAGGTFTLGPSTYTGGPYGLLSLLGGDVTAVYILDAPLSVDDQAALVSFETARGSAGLITLGAELVADPSFDDPGYWTQFGAAVVSGGNLSFTNSTSGAGDACYRTGLTSSGKIYMAMVTATSVSSGRAEITIGQGVGQASFVGITSARTYRLIGTNGSSLNRAPRIANAILGGEPLNATFSSVSLREVIMP